MGKLFAQFTMSLDGFIAGPQDDVSQLFRWYYSGDTPLPVAGMEDVFKVSRASARMFQEMLDQLGALVTGRRDFDVSEAWGGQSPYPGIPIFIVTHHVPPEWAGADSPFTFVTGGVERAVDLARKASNGKNVGISGSTIVQQCLAAGLIDEIHIDIAPVLLGSGIRLFERLENAPIHLEIIRVIDTPAVTHVHYRVSKA